MGKINIQIQKSKHRPNTTKLKETTKNENYRTKSKQK